MLAAGRGGGARASFREKYLHTRLRFRVFRPWRFLRTKEQTTESMSTNPGASTNTGAGKIGDKYTKTDIRSTGTRTHIGQWTYGNEFQIGMDVILG